MLKNKITFQEWIIITLILGSMATVCLVTTINNRYVKKSYEETKKIACSAPKKGEEKPSQKGGRKKKT